MKKSLFFVLLLLVFALASCNKDQSTNDKQTSTLTELPAKAADYIDMNYPDADVDYILAVQNSNMAFLVTLTTNEELAFDSDGGFIGNISGNHNTGFDCDTIYGHHHGGHHGGGIPVDSLSSAILEYISANYPDYTIFHAKTDSLCPDGAVTEVVIGMPEVQPVKLIFGADDTFLMTSVRIPYVDVPQVIKDYISLNFGDSLHCNKASQLTLVDNTIQYMIYLRLEESMEKLRMGEDGSLVCEESDTTFPGGGHHGGGHHGGGHHGGGNGGHHNGGWIPVDSLSATILEYISANYPDYTIMHAKYDSICPDGEVIKVAIGQMGTWPFDLVFGAEDAYLFTSNMVHYWDLPQAVRDFIEANYLGWWHIGNAERFTMTDSSLQYTVFLKQQQEMKKIRVAEDGTLICEQ